MGNYNSTAIRTDIENDILQSSKNVCTIKVSQSITGSVFVSDGDINIRDMDNMPLSCVITNTFDAQVSNSIADSIKQTASTENGLLLPSAGANTNIANISENIRNRISQIMNNSCSLTTAQDITNSVLISKNGSINITQDNNQGAFSSCQMQNTASATVVNSVSNTVAQTATITNAITSIILILTIGGTIAAIGTKAFGERKASNTLDIDSLKKLGISNLGTK